MKLGDSTARNTKARGKQILCGVASGILPDVEGGILPRGKNAKIISHRQNPFTSLACARFPPPGWKPGSTAGREARRHFSRCFPARFSFGIEFEN